jgi:RNA polymerase sigma factor (sigma-70 family)
LAKHPSFETENEGKRLPMTTTKEIDEAEKFEKLLVWLDEDPEAAGRKYESIRRRLIWIFRRYHCTTPEDLADETFVRVTQKIKNLAESYDGDPARYFYSVAKNILHEYFRRPQMEELPLNIKQPEASPEESERSDCLTICLQTLTDEQRHLIIGYYDSDDEISIINHRKALAEQLEISPTNLRRKAFRLRNILQKCVLNCLAKKKV